MMQYTIYDPVTGKITQIVTNQTPTSNNYIAGRYSPDNYYIDIDTKLPVNKSVKPFADYIFDYNIKQWVLPPAPIVTEQQARLTRDQLLTTIDRVNPIWYASLTSEQQQELQTYRQALLDITDQPGFPADIQWPSKPTWL